MAGQPAHAQWCALHERYYRGVCPFCRDDVPAHRIPTLERGKPAPQRRVQPRVAVRQGHRRGDPVVRPDRAKLRAARVARGWSVTELARQADLSQGHVREIEAGLRQHRISLQTAQRLAKALATTVAALTEGAPDE